MLGCQQCATCEGKVTMAFNSFEELHAVVLEVLGEVVGETTERPGDTSIASVCHGRDTTRLRAPALLHSAYLRRQLRRNFLPIVQL